MFQLTHLDCGELRQALQDVGPLRPERFPGGHDALVDIVQQSLSRNAGTGCQAQKRSSRKASNLRGPSGLDVGRGPRLMRRLEDAQDAQVIGEQ